MRVIPESQNSITTTTLDKYVAANDNNRGQYIGLTRQGQTHRDFVSSVEDWRAATDRMTSGLAALARLPGYIYLGSPYSKCADLDKAARDVAEAAGALMNLGLAIYCPIAHGHALSAAASLPQTWDFWKRQCDPMIDAAAALIVLTMDGWQESVGLTYEIATFLVAQKPILYLSPEELGVGGEAGEGRAAA